MSECCELPSIFLTQFWSSYKKKWTWKGWGEQGSPASFQIYSFLVTCTSWLWKQKENSLENLKHVPWPNSSFHIFWPTSLWLESKFPELLAKTLLRREKLELILWNQWEEELGLICLESESFIFIWTTELVPRKAPGLCPDLCKLFSMWFYCCSHIYQLMEWERFE